MYSEKVTKITHYYCNRCTYSTPHLPMMQQHVTSKHEDSRVVGGRNFIYLETEKQAQDHMFAMNEDERKDVWEGPGWYFYSYRNEGVLHSATACLRELRRDIEHIEQDICTLTEFFKTRPNTTP